MTYIPYSRRYPSRYRPGMVPLRVGMMLAALSVGASGPIGPYTPINLPITGSAVREWWNGEGISEGQTEWVGRRSGLILTAGAPAALTTLNQGGFPALQGNGTTVFYTADSSIASIAAGLNKPCSIIIVWEGTVLSGTGPLCLFSFGGSTPSQPYMTMQFDTANRYVFLTRQGDAGAAAAPQQNPTVFDSHHTTRARYVWEFYYDGTQAWTFVNNIPMHVAVPLATGLASFETFSIFCSSIGGTESAFFNGKISEVITYNSNILANRAEVRDLYWSPKYNDPLALGYPVLVTDILATISTCCNSYEYDLYTDPDTGKSFASWYNHSIARNFYAVKLPGPDEEWSPPIPSPLIAGTSARTDQHEVITIMTDGDDVAETFYDMHGTPMTAALAAVPNSLNFTAPLTPPIVPGSTEENDVTYPTHLRESNGSILTAYREGTSGAGNFILIRRSPGDTVWQDVQTDFLNGSSGGRSAYINRPAIGPNDELFFWFCWRETGDVNTNHDISCIQSLDGGATWFRMDGSPQPMPATLANGQVNVAIPQNNGLINTCGSALDDNIRPWCVMYWDLDSPNGDTQYMVVRWDGAAFQTHQVTQFTTPYHLSTNIAGMRLSRPDAAYRNGRAYVIGVCTEMGPGIWCWSSTDWINWVAINIFPQDVGNYEPTHDDILWRTQGIFRMKVQYMTMVPGDIDPSNLNYPPSYMAIVDIPEADMHP